MISLFKKRSHAEVNFSAIGTDMHSHLLPGIDDGAQDTTQSIGLIKGLQQLGYSKFITTPHIMVDPYPNTAETIGQAFDELKQAAGNVPVQPAAEYMLDENFGRLLAENKPLLCLRDKIVLLEFSFISIPLDYRERLFQLQLMGYQPVLAHPERYLYFANARNAYDDLRSAGCQFACNILSFTNYYGKGPQELVNYLLKNDCIDYLGTDIHHTRHLEALQKAHSVMPVIQKLADSGRLLNRQL